MSRYYEVVRGVETPMGKTDAFIENKRVCDACGMEQPIVPPWSPDSNAIELVKWGLLEGADERHPLFDFCSGCLGKVATLVRSTGANDFATNLDEIGAAYAIEKRGGVKA